MFLKTYFNCNLFCSLSVTFILSSLGRRNGRFSCPSPYSSNKLISHCESRGIFIFHFKGLHPMELTLWTAVKGKPISKKIKEGLEVREKALVFAKYPKVAQHLTF